MKRFIKSIEFTAKEAFYFTPSIFNNSFCWLFFIVWFNREPKRNGYILPFLTLSWHKGEIIFWAIWGKNGWCIKFNEKRKIHRVVTGD